MADRHGGLSVISVSEGSNRETPHKLANKTDHGHQALGLLERPWLNKVEGQSKTIRRTHTTHAYPYTCVRTHTKTCIQAHSHHTHIHTQLVKVGGLHGVSSQSAGWSRMLVISARRRQGQEDQEFKTNFNYISSCLEKENNVEFMVS